MRRRIHISRPHGEFRAKGKSHEQPTGSGGNFGFVTSLRAQLHERRHMLAGPVIYPMSEAEPVLRRYAEFAAVMPDELGISVGMTSSENGEPILLFLPLWNGDQQQGERIISDFLSLGTPRLAQVGPMTYSDMLALFDAWLTIGDPEGHVFVPFWGILTWLNHVETDCCILRR